MTSPLCVLANWLPGHVGHALEEAKQVGHQWRETSWTDAMLLALKNVRDPRIIVRTSNEPVTGADMDWIFVRRGPDPAHLRLTVQAKILHYTRDRVPDRYDELAYPRHAQGQQARKLVLHSTKATKSGNCTYPLYLFYNPSSADIWGGRLCAAGGVSLANGYRIRHHLERHRTGHRIPVSALELSVVRPFMFDLPAIFCGSPNIPSPENVADALVREDYDVRYRTGSPQRPRQPVVCQGIPPGVSTLIWQASAGDDDDDDLSPVRRNTVLFLSDDER